MCPMQTSEPSLDRVEVEKLHEEMLDEIRCQGQQIASDDRRGKEFMNRFDGLVGQFKQLAGQVNSEEEFDWLTRVACQWEEPYFSVFRKPRNLRAEIGISVPPPGLEPAYKPLPDQNVQDYLRAKANDIARERKLTRLFQRWAELKSHPDRLHAEIPSQPDEMKEDWYWASVYFAADVLEGEIRFANRIGPELYPMLEGVWLKDVKRLKAYLLWEHDGSHWQPDGGKEYFFKAANLVRDTALGEKLKASPSTFAHAKTYIEQLYLSDGVVNSVGDSTAHHLVVNKAQRIWAHSARRRGAEANWAEAERYVRGFYEHIIPAVKEADPQHIAALAEAFCSAHRGPRPCDIVNCFEAALVVYYVDPEKLKAACGTELHLLF